MPLIIALRTKIVSTKQFNERNVTQFTRYQKAKLS